MPKFKFFIAGVAAMLMFGAGCKKIDTTPVVTNQSLTLTTPATLTDEERQLRQLIEQSVNTKDYAKLIPYTATPTFFSYLEGSEYAVRLPPEELPKELSRIENSVPLNFDQSSSEINHIKKTQLNDEERGNSFIGFSKDQKQVVIFIIVNGRIISLGVSFL